MDNQQKSTESTLNTGKLETVTKCTKCRNSMLSVTSPGKNVEPPGVEHPGSL
jgi:hypothetical protein